MRFYYPRSFFKLLFFGFALIALPLMFALINNAISIDRLGNLSQKAVYQAVQATQSSRKLAEIIPAMERAAHQMLILGDRSLLDTYIVHRKQLLATAAEFARLPFDSEQRSALREIVGREVTIYDLLSSPNARPEDLQKAVQSFVGLAERAQEIDRRSNTLIDREVENMRATARQAQRITLWQLLALFPVVIFLVIGFTILIARPIRQIDEAIRRLGQADFSVPVRVGGPEDLQHLGEQLDWMRLRLADLEQQKNRFLRHMSHELKTPLTALREGAELLTDEVVGKLSPEQREVAEILRHNSIELQKLIEDLLSYGAGQSHKPSLDLARVELKRIMSRVLDDQKLALRSKGLALNIDVQDLTLTADFEKVRVMFDNLVSNAIKFSPVGGTIVIAGRHVAGNVLIDVCDQGPGIAAEERKLVFEPFYRGNLAADTLVKGTGIGLSVVREYAQMHGGNAEIVATSAGARVRVRLPLTPSIVAHAPEAAAAAEMAR
ncbi:MAG: periplasmic sensor signal transduction histidine kinase [Betaproteobacteria bacterium]|jgi:two-component system sensor histidine kinase GlrK|nr:periplasmic sensor signal transduction histidine kinase [Betaproteobacteria bacterium]MEA3153749.1 two-component system, NtrC family, sensor histidine kinase GlrK [Betaproteobacteria bacterium]